MASHEMEAGTIEVAIEVTVLVVSCLVTVLANGMVLTAVIFREKLHSPTYYYYLSLAASDLILGVLCIPLVTTAFLMHRWPLGDTLCQIYAVLISVSANASIVILSIISFDRYQALSKPMENRARLTLTKRRYKLIIAGAWVHSLFWASGPLFRWGSTDFDSVTHTCKPNWGGEGIANRTYVIGLATFAFAVPVGVMLYSYIRVYQIARASRKEGSAYKLVSTAKGERSDGETGIRKEATILRKSDENKDGGGAVGHSDKKYKALKTVLLLIGSFAGCWSLYTVVTMWKLFAPESVTPWVVRAGLVLTLCHSSIDPWIYSIRNEKMRQEIKNMFGKLFSKGQ